MMTTTTSNLKPAVMTVQQFCDWAHVGRSRAYDQINSGALRMFKFGRRTLIRTVDAEAWLDAISSGLNPQVQL